MDASKLRANKSESKSKMLTWPGRRKGAPLRAPQFYCAKTQPYRRSSNKSGRARGGRVEVANEKQSRERAAIDGT